MSLKKIKRMLDLVNKSQAGLTKMIKIKRKIHFYSTKLEQLLKYTFYICLFELIPKSALCISVS